MAKIIKKAPWYSGKEGLFGPEYMREYENILTPERTKMEADFLVKTLGMKKKSSILDVPCGFGRHSLEFAKRGFEVTGIDLNDYFLNKAKRAAKKENVKIKFIKGDMRKIPFQNEFDLAINLYTSFGYFENEKDDETMIREVAKALKKGGKFVIDTLNRERVLSEHLGKGWSELSDGSVILYERKYDYVSGRSYEKRIIVEKIGKRKTVNISLMLYTLHELVLMLEKSGFRLESIFGDFGGSDYNKDSMRCIVISIKK